MLPSTPASSNPQGWGKIFVATRLEKMVSSRFVQVWSALITQGLRSGDITYAVRGLVAHKASNLVVRQFLKTDCDTLFMLDSDADIDADFLNRFRDHEAGWSYDILQAFYPRRGWPPRAIWMRENALGVMTEYFITDPDTVQDVSIAGTHSVLIRRRVFEGMLGDSDPKTHEWFFYPRHAEHSEDGAFSMEAGKAGYRIGATTHVKAGHICEVTTDWNSYQEYLQISGRTMLIDRYRYLANRIADFTGESPDVVVAKSQDSGNLNRAAWANVNPQTAAETRAFYGSRENGYLYDLLHWNCQPAYETIIGGLRRFAGRRALVIGGGLGTEAEYLMERNAVEVFELPGVLRDFLRHRWGDRLTLLDGATLADVVGRYDLIVAIDTLEHVHPDEFRQALDKINDLLLPGGILYCHNNFGQQADYPMHYDHSAVFGEWLTTNFSQLEAYQWQKN